MFWTKLKIGVKFELKIGGNFCRFVAPYRFPSQTLDDFCHFHRTMQNLDIGIAKTPMPLRGF